MSDMYTERLLDHYRHPRNKGHLDAAGAASGPGKIVAAQEYNPLCGDRVAIEARLEGDRVTEVRFDGRGCALCMAAASILTEMVQGRTLEELAVLSQEEFLAELQSPIRPARLKCALLPWQAFRRALFGEKD
jgi:nitrogen fixation NifU-like protein